MHQNTNSIIDLLYARVTRRQMLLKRVVLEHHSANIEVTASDGSWTYRSFRGLPIHEHWDVCTDLKSQNVKLRTSVTCFNILTEC